MREIRRMESDERERIRYSGVSPIIKAVEAMKADDPDVAAQYWDEAVRVIPDVVLRSEHSIAILLGIKRYDELEALMLKGHKRWPARPLYVSGMAQMWMHRNDRTKASDWWKKLRLVDSRNIDAYLNGAFCERSLGNLSEAKQILEQANAIFDWDPRGWAELAIIAEMEKDWDTALKHWDHVAGPLKHWTGDVGGARVCHATGDIPGALARLENGRQAHSQKLAAMVALAELEERIGMVDLALKDWSFVKTLFPGHVPAYVGCARCLRQKGDLDDAYALLQVAMQKFPTSRLPVPELAELEHQRELRA
jgi:tetratricopeptide (TPR) repeat protein